MTVIGGMIWGLYTVVATAQTVVGLAALVVIAGALLLRAFDRLMDRASR